MMPHTATQCYTLIVSYISGTLGVVSRLCRSTARILIYKDTTIYIGYIIYGCIGEIITWQHNLSCQHMKTQHSLKLKASKIPQLHWGGLLCLSLCIFGIMAPFFAGHSNATLHHMLSLYLENQTDQTVSAATALSRDSDDGHQSYQVL